MTTADRPNLRIDSDRLWASLMELARIGGTEKGGVCRIALTDLDTFETARRLQELTGPLTTPMNAPSWQPAAARSSAAQATKAPSPVGFPGSSAYSSSPTAIFSAAVANDSSHWAGPITATPDASTGCAASQARSCCCSELLRLRRQFVSRKRS